MCKACFENRKGKSTCCKKCQEKYEIITKINKKAAELYNPKKSHIPLNTYIFILLGTAFLLPPVITYITYKKFYFAAHAFTNVTAIVMYIAAFLVYRRYKRLGLNL